MGRSRAVAAVDLRRGADAANQGHPHRLSWHLRCSSRPRISAHKGVRCGKKRVARLMRTENLQGVHRRKKFRTTQPDEGAAPAPDLVDRDFSASALSCGWRAI
jgi:hypothetical protein